MNRAAPDAPAVARPEALDPVTGSKVGLRAWLLLALLFLAYIFSLMDRMILALLVTPIKADLGISDTQIGLLQGLAFVLLYSVLGLPIGRLVDRANRTRIIGFGIAVWSVATAFCGMAGQYWQLFLGRIGVGVGEATLSPASYSLIADSFPPARLGIATSIFALGASAGSGLALVIGGTVVHWAKTNGPVTLPVVGTFAPWQQVFMLLGLPGLLLASAFFFIAEPARRQDGGTVPAWGEIRHYLNANRKWLALHFTAVGATTVVLYGTTAWIIALFERVHGWNVATAGAATGVANVAGATLGLLGGGWLSDKARGRSNAHRLLICSAALLLCFFFSVSYPLVADGRWSAVLWGGVMMMAGVPIGVAGANLQEAVPGRMRGVVSAIYFFCINAIGAGLGPVLVPLVAARLAGGPTAIAPALAWVAGTASVVAALVFYLAFAAQRGSPVAASTARP